MKTVRMGRPRIALSTAGLTDGTAPAQQNSGAKAQPVRQDLGDSAPLAPNGLIYTPPPAALVVPPGAKVIAGHKNAPHFAAFMRVENLSLEIERQGQVSQVQVPALCGMGHNCTMVTAVLLDAEGRPNLLIKGGNTRAAHTMRGRAYVSGGMIGGRWDLNVGADPAGIAKKVGIAEVAEEVGARVLKGGAFSLGERLVPTMPSASTEADLPVGVIARLDPAATITGDGSGMELVGLMKQVVIPVGEALAASRQGEISEGGRFEAYTRRFLDKLGYIPELDAYVHDLPPALQKAFQQHGTLGLGAAVDPRKLDVEAGHESAADISHAPTGAAKPLAQASQVNGVSFVETNAVQIPGFGVMYDAKTDHAVIGEDGQASLIGKVHPNQVLHVDHDLAKVAVYYLDPLRGPMVKLEPIERPVMAAKGTALADQIAYKNENYALVRDDLVEVKVPLPLPITLSPSELQQASAQLDIPKIAQDGVSQALSARGVKAELSTLGSPVFASPGQSDLQFHFFAARLSSPPSAGEHFLPLGEALRAVRTEGVGDAGTEAALLRLADALGWVPSLGMTLKRARKLADVG